MNGKVFGRRGLIVLMSLLVMLAMTAAPAFADLPPGAPTGVTLNQSALNLSVGATATLTATVTPAVTIGPYGIPVPTITVVTWVSSKPSVATVSPSAGVTAVVTATGPGSAIITAIGFDGIATATCTVTVTGTPGTVPVTGVTISTPSPLSVDVGQTMNLTATVTPSDATNPALTWKSDTPSVATVSSSGVVTGIAAGTANITATTQDGSNITSAPFVMNVVAAPYYTGMVISPSTLNLVVGATATLIAGFTPNGMPDEPEWRCSNPSVATFSNDGLAAIVVTATGPGSATITASAMGLSATCVVTVTAAASAPAAAAPTVTGISPNSGPLAGGTTVIIAGTGFTGATAVNFGSTAAAGVTVNSDNSITATSPAGSGTVDVAVATPAGISPVVTADQFTYTAATPSSTPTPTTPAAGQTVLQFYIGSSDYNVNGQAQSMDVAPMISNSRTLLPIKYVAGPFGATTSWDPAQQMVTVTMGSNTIQLVIGQNTATVNGVSTAIDPNNPDVAPVIVPPGRTMMPLSFIAKNLGCQVQWNQAQQLVTVTYPAP